MIIDQATIISLLSLFIAAVVAISGLNRDRKKDNKQDAIEMTTVIVKLENINDGISEIKSDQRNIKREIQEVREHVVIVDQSVKSAHHRIDEIVKQMKEGNREGENKKEKQFFQ
jgi:peptidoglycan hydrolase CwlO-like protein